jgi:hypothetical protein
LEGTLWGIYSEPRATKDFDVFIKSSRENAETIYRALAEYGAPLGDLKPEDFDGHPTTVVQIGIPPLRIDILQRITGVEFEEAWNDRLDALMGSIPNHVISRDHLIRNKLAVGRPRDLLDVEEIRKAALQEPGA